MESLIAKRYVEALLDGASNEEIALYREVFDGLSQAYTSDKFADVMLSVYVDSETKKEILLDSVKSVNNKKINNLLSLLSEKSRIEIIPAIAEELRMKIARSNNSYSGFIYSDEEIGNELVKKLADGLGSRTKSSVDLTFINNGYNGIKIEVDDLGVELSFSKSRIRAEMIDHILKAI